MVYTNKIYYNKRFLSASLLQYVITSCPIVESLLSQRHVQGNVTSKKWSTLLNPRAPNCTNAALNQLPRVMLQHIIRRTCSQLIKPLLKMSKYAPVSQTA